MKTLRAWIAAFVFAAFSLPSSASAQDATRLSLAREVVELSGGIDQIDALIEPLRPMIVSQVMHAGNMTPSDAARLGDLLLEEISASKPEMANLIATAYAERFTEAQLQEMRTFFASQTGQALRQNLPVLMESVSEASTTMGQQAALRALQRFLAERADGPRNPS